MLRIFVTTDNHVGYNELDPIRGNDAANSFDEAMSIAESQNVDLVIQGGDLFHLNKPSKHALYSVMKTLRRTCLNDKPIEFQILNHGPLTLDDAAEEFNHANFEDPNFNVGLPVFAVSGNHDDAGGTGTTNLISPLDVLSMSGLINHFGRIHDSTDIVVTPILIEKAGIRLALYGMASVRDERLYRTFRDNKVKFLRPREEPDTWYNILVVHQNHSQHGPTNFIPEQFLPNFMDLVIWGHEHECLIDPIENPNKGFKVMQPGSTVATSLSDSELKPKHAAIITIAPNKFMTCEKFKLRTVRPFAMRTVILASDAPHIKPTDREVRGKVTTWLMSQVDSLIEEATQSWLEHHNVERDSDNVIPPLPLVRLRVDYSGGYEVENTTRFSNRFANRVANSNDVLHLIKRRQTGDSRILPKTSSAGTSSLDTNEGASMNAGVEQVGHLVHKYLTEEHLKILLERGMGEALTKFVEKDDKVALKVGVDDLVKHKMDELLDPIRGLNLEEDTNNIDVRRNPENNNPVSTGFPASHTQTEHTFIAPTNSHQTKPTRVKPAPKKTQSTQPARANERSFSEPMEIDESEPEAILSSDDEDSGVRASTKTKPAASRGGGSSIRQAHPKRSSRQKAAIETPLPNFEAAEPIGDDSEEMFSPDEFG